MSGHVLKKLLNDEGEFTKREIVNGKKKLFIGPRNKSSIVVSSSSRSGQQKNHNKTFLTDAETFISLERLSLV